MAPPTLAGLHTTEVEAIPVASSLTSKPSFRAFLSHTYKAPRVNRFFYQLFAESAVVQFEVDPGGKSTSVTRLEARMLESDAFIGVFSFRGEDDSTCEPLPASFQQRCDILLPQSRYYRLETAIAARNRMPGLIFLDKQFSDIIDLPTTFHRQSFDPRDLLGPTQDTQSARFRKIIREFCAEVAAHGLRNVSKPDADRNRIGLFLSSLYTHDEHNLIIRQIGRYYPPHRIDCFQYPVSLTLDAIRRLDSLSFAVVDIGAENMGRGLIGYLHGIGLPLIRLAKECSPDDSQSAVMNLDSVRYLYGGLEAGYRKDIICWDSLDGLADQLAKRFELLRYEPVTLLTTNQADAYFAKAAKRNESVFVSYSARDAAEVQPIIERLKQRFQEVFDYKDKERILPGQDWRGELYGCIAASQVGIAFLSQNYLDSDYCKTEANHFAQHHTEKGMVVIPLIVAKPDEKIDFYAALPAFVGLQYERASSHTSPEGLLARIERAIDEAATKKKVVPFPNS